MSTTQIHPPTPSAPMPAVSSVSAPAVVSTTARRQLHQVGGRRAWAVWGAAASVYVLAIFYRTSLGVAGLVAADRFHITAAQLATFTVLQLAVYAGMQIPVGVLLDRFGARRMLLIGLALMTAAQVAFALVDGYAGALAARGLLGAGDAMVFVSVLRLVAVWFPARRVPLVSQATGQTGVIGSILATIPLASALRDYGWTPTFLVGASFSALVLLLLLVLVKDSPWSGQPAEAIRVRTVLDSLRATWAMPGNRLGMWTHFTALFGPLLFGLLWGYPFLVKGEGLTEDQAGLVLIAMTATSVLSGLLVARITSTRPIHRGRLALGIVVTIMLSWAVLLAWPGRAPMWLVVAVALVTSIGGPGSGIGFDMARAFNPAHRLGSALGVVNLGGFVATLGAMALVGAVLDWRAPGGPTTYTLEDFRVAMAVQFVFWIGGVAQIWRYRERTRELLETDHPEAWEALQGGALLLPGLSRPHQSAAPATPAPQPAPPAPTTPTT